MNLVCGKQSEKKFKIYIIKKLKLTKMTVKINGEK